MTSSNLPFKCQEYKELPSIDSLSSAPGDLDLFQLKYDGIWALVQIAGGVASVFSKTGQLKTTFPVRTQQRIILVGEYMFGSQWAQAAERKGRIFIFDCLLANGVDISTAPYRSRYSLAVEYAVGLGHPLEHLPCYNRSALAPVWQHLVSGETHEGVVLRGSEQAYSDTLYKLKREVEDDFVALGFIEGKGKHAGRLGAITLGQYNPAIDDIEAIGEVGGGFSDSEREMIWQQQERFRGQVILVKGKSRFDSGALRHPNFVRFRSDKTPLQCVLKRQSS